MVSRFIGLITTAMLALCAPALADTTDTAKGEAESTPTASKFDVSGMKPLEEGVYYRDIKVGDGAEVSTATTTRAHYIGTLNNGKVFENSRIRALPTPLDFKLGTGQVVKGLEIGVQGMKKGGVRFIHIPFEQAYGKAGRPPTIPPSSDINFEIEIVDVL
ncbi:MAG: FKBP-type peptidyl-prolyl cis-trans isomerase [Candidatus Sumerlaeaceae bacterium]|nr:FKBP-type peptidyl-prolyl cis-trans isomerase [Candidatus Sumerlaeaceae bacterium]